MTELTKYVVYFLLGGTLVSLSTYLGAHGKGFFAALASQLPVISALAFILIYLNAGGQPTLSFAKNLLWLSPAWFVYVFVMLFCVPRLGFWISFAGAMTLYALVVLVTKVMLR